MEKAKKMNRNDPVFTGVTYSLRSLLESSDLLQNVSSSSKFIPILINILNGHVSNSLFPSPQ